MMNGERWGFSGGLFPKGVRVAEKSGFSLINRYRNKKIIICGKKY